MPKKIQSEPVIELDATHKKIKAEYDKLCGIFKDLPQDIKKTADKLINNAAFMAVTLEDLAEFIAINGCTEEYQNGANQSGKKKSSEVDVYNTMIKNYKAVMDSLIGLLPKAEVKQDDGFEDFVNSRE